MPKSQGRGRGRRKSQAWLVGISETQDLVLLTAVKDKADGIKALKALGETDFDSFRVIRLISGVLHATVKVVHNVAVEEQKDSAPEPAKGEKDGKGTE